MYYVDHNILVIDYIIIKIRKKNYFDVIQYYILKNFFKWGQ